MALNLEKQLTFYGKYHHNNVNIAIHTLCVPLILFTFITLATNTPPLIPLPSYLTIPNLPLNGGTLIALIYGSLFFLLEPIAGALCFPILLGVAAYSNHLITIDPSLTTKVAAGINVVSWLAQFLGHGVFEGKAPALLDNLVQALFLGPFFVWMKVLFTVGYRPELQSRVEKEVVKELEKEKKEKKEKNGKPVKNGKAN